MYRAGAISAPNRGRPSVANPWLALSVCALLVLIASEGAALKPTVQAAPKVSVVAPAPVPVVSAGPDRSRFTAHDLALVSVVVGAASFAASVVLYQLSQRALIRLDERLSSRDEQGLIKGISHAKATEELNWINNQRMAASVTAGLGLAVMGFGVGVIAATPARQAGVRTGLRMRPLAGGAWAGWEFGW